MKKKEELEELRVKNTKELLGELKKDYDELRKFRFQAKMRELKDIHKIEKTRQKIAQILTILRETLTTEAKSEKKT